LPMGLDALTACVLSHHGAVRDHNEDAVVVGSCTFSEVDADAHGVTIDVGEPRVIAVADGLGGHAAGEIAAGHAVRRLAQLADGMGSQEQITQTLRSLDEEIATLSQVDPRIYGMGTTVVGLVVAGAYTWWFNVGDSRLYRFDGVRLEQLSVDDIPEADDETGRRSGIVTQVLGGGTREPIAPHVAEVESSVARRYLLCSDGLSDMVAAADLEAIMAANSEDDAAAARALWSAAMRAGGFDNITLVLVRVPPSDPVLRDEGSPGPTAQA
jgi:serine/threonine protein phosphatase PrpC